MKSRTAEMRRAVRALLSMQMPCWKPPWCDVSARSAGNALQERKHARKTLRIGHL